MIDSEVFDNLVKIAIEQGIISEGSEPEHTAKNTKNPRWDSQDISTIEALYGVKPNMPKGMEYENNIMENAHPDSVVISPSYDKLNGLVENNIERQNILKHIIYKQPEIGTPNQFRYPMSTSLYPNTKHAQKDLMLALVRVGNDMDNRDNDELRILADACLNQVHYNIRKEAAIILPIAIGIAAVFGGIYLQQHLANLDRGLTESYNRLQESLDAFMNSSVGLGFGHEYDVTLKEHVSGLKNRLSKFWDTYQKVTPIIEALERPKDHNDVIKMAQDPKIISITEAHKELLDEVNDLYSYLDKISKDFENIDYKAEHTQKGAVVSLLDSIPFLHGSGKGSLLADDFDRVINAITPFRTGVKRLMDSLNGADDVVKKSQEEIAASLAKTKSELSPASQTSVNNGKTVEDLDKEHADLSSSLTSGLSGIIPGI